MATTPTGPQRRTPAAPDSTQPPAPARNPGHPSLNMASHAGTPAVTGPPAWEGSGAVTTPSSPPPLHCPGAQFRPHADAQITRTVGVNPDPPATRSASVDADTSSMTAGNAAAFMPYGDRP